MARIKFQPHDQIFKYEMSKRKVAKDFLQRFLPKDLLNIIDLSTLRLENKSFADSEADLIYSAKRNNSRTRLFILCEHKSYPDRSLPLQMLHYVRRIWEQHKKQFETELPVIFPICLYHGKPNIYPYPESLWDQFSDPLLAKRILLEPIHMVNLNELSDTEILESGHAQVLLALQKHIHSTNFENDFQFWLDQPSFHEKLQEDGADRIRNVLEYLYSCVDIKDEETLIDKLTFGHSEYQEIIMTLREKWIERGRQEGRQEGHQEGHLEGKKLGSLLALKRTARNMLRAGLPRHQVLEWTQLPESELNGLVEKI